MGSDPRGHAQLQAATAKGESNGGGPRLTRVLLVFAPLAALVALVVIFATQISRDPEYIPSVLIDKPAPEFSLPAVAGLDVPGFDSSSLKGQVSVVNVFGSWCVPCRDEHPVLMALQQTGIAPIYGINWKDAPENATAFLAQLGNPFDAVGADPGRVALDWGVTGAPETYVVDADGIIVFKYVGPLTRAALTNALLPAIARAAGRA